eukprot:6586557-Pyramimonas_sp.AAC.1
MPSRLFSAARHSGQRRPPAACSAFSRQPRWNTWPQNVITLQPSPQQMQQISFSADWDSKRSSNLGGAHKVVGGGRLLKRRPLLRRRRPCIYR